MIATVYVLGKDGVPYNLESAAILWALKKWHRMPCVSTVLHNALNGSKLVCTIRAFNRGCIVLSNR